MDILNFKDRLFNKGREYGFSDMELYYQSNGKFSTKIFKGEVDSYNLAIEGGVSFRGIYNGQMGYAYTEKINEEAISFLLEEAKENGKIIDSEDSEVIFAGSEHYEELTLFSEELASISADEKIALLKKVEAECFALSEKVSSVNYCLLESHDTEKMIANTKGLEKHERGNVVYTYLSVVVKDGDDIKSAGKLTLSRNFSMFDPIQLAKEVVDEALSALGASSIASKEYPIILKNTAAASLLQTFTSAFSADNVQKGKSRLAKKLDTTIANQLVTIVDDPFLTEGFMSRSFDSEGVATKRLQIVEDGVLKTYLHNLKTATKDNVESTGHGTKSSYKGTITVAPSNLYINPGQSTYEQLVENEPEALIITDLQGLHSGANPISGDFSLAANGYLVKNGQIERPVNQITIAGNFFTMLEQVESIADDLTFGLPMGGYVGSPSLKIKGLAVAGE
ncbi:TldD/PmbA family protein [Anaerobacillus isosaccharinicus]|uniref:TldD/PmbA family protein n=1 Tax=Anaerobacillus isosaccharinicus TaxID=1532552 RepID=A0A7S7L5Y2_9BACI|nr:TldD/PmbA family protein [Anaerobacillus isosaccharinicus]MBA5586723.1 TldD/PmbA family protein [Anaerobacillus isosaccharinicus]QOY35054.1 TldD/PmbA family protein [Anaerobacillus isosaccharinicus]